MATVNPFGLLGDDDAEDPALLLAAQQKASAPASAPKNAQAQPPAKLPSKPLPPAQAVRESRNENQRGGHGSGRGGARGRGGHGFNRESVDNEKTFSNSNGFSGGYRPSEDGEAEKTSSGRRPYGGPRGDGGFHVGPRGVFSNGEAAEGEHPQRVFERRSGTGRGNESKCEGGGRGNWGTPIDEIVLETEEPAKVEKHVDSEKESRQDDAGDTNKDSSPHKQEQNEPGDKEMTLEEYEKVLKEKKKTLLSLKSEERKVSLDKEFESMQLLSNKKNGNEVFVKLGSEKDKRKEAAEKAKKAVSINEFLKPAEGDNHYRAGGRGRGGYGGSNYNVQAPAIEDVGQFPSLSGK